MFIFAGRVAQVEERLSSKHEVQILVQPKKKKKRFIFILAFSISL
jgi:hypothetical protein